MKKIDLVKNKYLLVIILLWCSFNTEVCAQIDEIIYNSIPKELQPSPEASSLGKYGNTPMSLFTGTPNISIPLYEIKLKNQSFPISLLYNASGIKVDEISSWVGLGWSLNAGGCITRKVNDMPDEKFEQKIPGFNSSIDFTNTATYSFIKEVCFAKSYDRKTDTQLDDYHYNFLGYSGKFAVKSGIGFEYIFGGNGGMKIAKISDGFEITMSNGYKYYFTEIEKSILTSEDYGGTSGISSDLYNGSVNSAWYLTSIVSPTNTTITFKYKKAGSLTILDYTKGVTIGYFPNYNILQIGGGFLDYQYRIQNSSVLTTTSIINQIYLSEIEFPNGKIVFESENDRKDNPDGLRLTAIKVYDSNATEVKKIDFKQEYFTSTKGSNAFTKEAGKYRLKLSSLNIGGQAYIFKYKSEILPIRYSFAKDWQGYYNGRDSNEDLLPYIENINIQNPTTNAIENKHMGNADVSREVNLSKTQACMLDAVYYPTGGYTKYEYENHTIKDQEHILNIGGLRLKSQKDYDANNKFLTGKSYDYGYGKLNAPYYAHEYETGDYIYEIPTGTMMGTEIKYKTYTLYSNILRLSPNGSLVSYPDIYEYSIDSNDNKLGSTYYNFSFRQDATYSTNFKSPFYFTDNSAFRGNLVKKEVRDNNNELKYKQIFDYSILERSYVALYNFHIKPTSYPYSTRAETYPSIRSTYYTYWWMPVYSYTQNPFKEREITYLNGDSVIVDKEMGYRTDLNFNKLTSVNYNSILDGDVKVSYEYPLGTENDIIKEMTDKNIYPLMGEKIEKNGKIVKYTKVPYDKFNGFFLPAAITENRETSPTYTNIDRVLKYDKSGKPLHIKTVDNTDVVYLWSYKGIYPLAEMKKATYEQVTSIIGEDFLLELSQNIYSEAEISNKISMLQGQITGVQIQRYSYPSALSNFLYGTPSSVTIKECFKYGPNNKPVHVQTSTNEEVVYVWGSNGQYPFIEIRNVSYSQIEGIIGSYIDNIYKSSSVGNDVIARLYQGLPNASEQVSIYSYPVELLKTTINLDSKKVKEYLKYDDFGNPIYLIKDQSVQIVYLWGYRGQYPIAEIQNASYEDVKAVLLGETPESLSSAAEPNMDLVNSLRWKLPKAQVTTYTYSPLIGMKTATNPLGQVTKYDYDWEARLKTIYLVEDGKDRIIKRYEYNLPGYNHSGEAEYVDPKPEPIDPVEPENPGPTLTPDPYKKGKASSVLINIGAKGDGSYGLTGWNYDTQKVELNNVITKTYKTIEAGEYIWTTENLRLKYGTYGSINMNWVNLTQADVDKYANEYLNGQKIPLEEFEQVFGTWVTLYDVAMMYRNIYWGVPNSDGTFDHTWGLPTKEDIWQMYGQAPRTTGNVYEDIKDFLFASACDNKFGWTQNMFNRRNISGLTLTPLGMRESNQGGAIYGFGQVASLQTATWAGIETLSDRDLSGQGGIISNPYSYHFTQARHRRPLTDQELGYKMYIDAANDQILMLAYNQASSLPELAKGLERGIALRYANREHMKVLKKWSEIQAEAIEIKSKLAPTNYPAPPALLPCEKEPEPEITADPYTKGKESTILINIGAKGDGSYGLTGWNYDTKKVELNNVITKTYKTIEAGEYIWTTENLRLKYGTYGSINMNWVNLTQSDVDKYSADYLGGKSIPVDEFEQVYGTWATLYDVAMMYRNIYWGVPTGVNIFDHTWGIPTKEDIWQMYGQAPRISDNLYNDIKDFLFASSSDFNFGWTQGLFKNKNTSGLTLTPLGMRESNQAGAIYGFGQVTSLQTSTWAAIETLSDRDLSGKSGLISNPYSYHFTQARHRRPLTDQELGYKMYIDAANDQVLMLPYDQVSILPELPKGLERGVALRYANRKAMKVVKKWSEIQAEASEIKSLITK